VQQSILFKSPFTVSGYTPKNDIYISVWFKYDSNSFTKEKSSKSSFLLRCENGEKFKAKTIDITMNND
jgi:hypothetical protein